jgi:hypothetical protein
MDYNDALARGRAAGAAHADDAALMAMFCDTALPHLVGAVSPKLVWEGAQKKRMSTLELSALANSDADATAALMWS